MEEIIFKYLNNTITESERGKLKIWLEDQEENRITLSKLSAFYRNDEANLPTLKEKVWDEVNQKFEKSNESNQSMPTSNIGWIMKMAAIFLLGSVFAFVIYQLSTGVQEQESFIVKTIIKEAPAGSKITTRLPDGSIVMLNSGSSISFPESFDGDTREVHLEGEAFFDVQHDPGKPFKVQMDEDVVQVLGTSFNIRSYPEDSEVFVAVATGRVSYTIPSGDEVILEPGRMATYSPGSGSLKTGEVNIQKVFGWKDKILYFDDSSFDKVITELERWYGVEIVYENDFGSRGTYTEQFDNPTIAEALHSLSFVYRFQFEVNENKITLSKIK
ncbi:MAG: FecR domain-containing protein [Cyclobacteriaceae bacterium]